MYMTDKNVKIVIVRAIDKKGNGVKDIKMQITKLTNPVNSLQLQGTTLSDGYTANINSTTMPSLSQKVPIVGTWQIRLDNASQSDKFYDLLVFLMYEYKERK